MHRELVVLSHLRWDWVWQRPQHLVSRLGRHMDATWFVEEPRPSDVSSPTLAHSRDTFLHRAWLDIPDPGRSVSFEFPYIDSYRRQLPDLVGPPVGERIVWLYTPLALEAARALQPTVLVFDVMDDLASFKDAPTSLVAAHEQALAEADVVFCGGRSLHRAVVERGRTDAHLFPSGVDPDHYATCRQLTVERSTRVAGYVGVIDERIDLDLVVALAAALPDWEIEMVGPVAKIDPYSLPSAPNLRFPGPAPYSRLPQIMAGFDVALMPFALNEATTSISPTKTLEYLAAGLPVVSTPVPDVVADYATVVDIQHDADGFADACRRVREHDLRDRDRKLRPLLDRHRWDGVADRMASIIEAVRPAESVSELTA